MGKTTFLMALSLSNSGQGYSGQRGASLGNNPPAVLHASLEALRAGHYFLHQWLSCHGNPGDLVSQKRPCLTASHPGINVGVPRRLQAAALGTSLTASTSNTALSTSLALLLSLFT